MTGAMRLLNAASEANKRCLLLAQLALHAASLLLPQNGGLPSMELTLVLPSHSIELASTDLAAPARSKTAALPPLILMDHGI